MAAQEWAGGVEEAAAACRWLAPAKEILEGGQGPPAGSARRWSERKGRQSGASARYAMVDRPILCICVYVCINIYIYIYIYICVCVYMCVCVYVYIYIHTCI